MAYDAERARDLRLQRQYGITSADYDAILAFQGGGCAVCRREPAPGKHLHVDHDHHTGLVRGLLCWQCNHRVIAKHRDPLIFRGAADYLEFPPATLAVGAKYGRTGRVTKKRRKPRKTKSTKSTKSIKSLKR